MTAVIRKINRHRSPAREQAAAPGSSRAEKRLRVADFRWSALIIVALTTCVGCSPYPLAKQSIASRELDSFQRLPDGNASSSAAPSSEPLKAAANADGQDSSSSQLETISTVAESNPMVSPEGLPLPTPSSTTPGNATDEPQTLATAAEPATVTSPAADNPRNSTDVDAQRAAEFALNTDDGPPVPPWQKSATRVEDSQRESLEVATPYRAVAARPIRATDESTSSIDTDDFDPFDGTAFASLSQAAPSPSQTKTASTSAAPNVTDTAVWTTTETPASNAADESAPIRPLDITNNVAFLPTPLKPIQPPQALGSIQSVTVTEIPRNEVAIPTSGVKTQPIASDVSEASPSPGSPLEAKGWRVIEPTNRTDWKGKPTSTTEVE